VDVDRCDVPFRDDHYNSHRSQVFFFSSRRRHTRSLRDWSSDVCSSDLTTEVDAALSPLVGSYLRALAARAADEGLPEPRIMQSKIGRASCRERVKISVIAVFSEKKKCKLSH